MSKKKRRRRQRRAMPASATNRHHLLFQGRFWSFGRARALRNVFVRNVPILVHRELHEKLHNIPVPPGDMLSVAWNKYKANKDEIDGYSIVEAAAWLHDNIPYSPFQQAMRYQIEYFAARPRDSTN